MIRKIYNLLPDSLKSNIRKVKEKRDLQKSAKNKKIKTISKNEIKGLLEGFDINSDIFLHTSLRKIGFEIEGGKDFISELMLDITKKNNKTLLVSALPFRTTMMEFLENTSCVDFRTAPNEMGAVNNLIMKNSNAIRSLHPTHSVVAIGEKAEEYCNNHHNDNTPFGVHSPYYKLLENKAKILLFGVDLDSLTFTHVIEDMLGEFFPVQVYAEKDYKLKVINFDGDEIEVTTKCHSPKISGLRKCESIRNYLVEGNAMQIKKLGMSELSVIDPIGYIRVVCELLLKGISIYGNVELSDKGKEKVIEILNKL